MRISENTYGLKAYRNMQRNERQRTKYLSKFISEILMGKQEKEPSDPAPIKKSFKEQFYLYDVQNNLYTLQNKVIGRYLDKQI